MYNYSTSPFNKMIKVTYTRFLGNFILAVTFLSLLFINNLKAQTGTTIYSDNQHNFKLKSIPSFSKVLTIANATEGKSDLNWVSGVSKNNFGAIAKISSDNNVVGFREFKETNEIKAFKALKNGNFIIAYAENNYEYKDRIRSKKINGLTEVNTEVNIKNATYLVELNQGLEIVKKIYLGNQIVPENIHLDSNGNIYLGGSQLSISDGSPSSLWIEKRDINYIKIWEFSGEAGQSATVFDLCANESGEVYACGWFNGNFSNKLAQSSDGIVLKLDSNGKLVWSNSFGGADFQAVRGIDLCSDGNIILCGWFWNELVISSANGYAPIKSLGMGDSFYAKLSPEGDLLMVKSIGGSGNDASFKVISKNSRIWISGWFGETINWMDQNFVATADRDAFIMEIGLNGDLLNFNNYSYESSDNGAFTIAVNNKNEVSIGGYHFNINSKSTKDEIGWIIKTDFSSLKSKDNNKILTAQPSKEITISDEKLKPKFEIYPNPTTERIFLQLNNHEEVSDKEYKIIITDITGKKLLIQSFDQVELIQKVNEISLDGFTSGTFILTITAEGEKIFTQKFIVE